jgi:hypothetical protein
MEIFKQFRLFSAIFILLLIAVLYRSFTHSVFRYDAAKMALPSLHGENIITEEQIALLEDKAFIIDIGCSDSVRVKSLKSICKISPDSIAEKRYTEKLLRHKGPIILLSSDNSISAKIWMLLSQKGIRNIFILSDKKEFEVLKYNLNPGSLSMQSD